MSDSSPEYISLNKRSSVRASQKYRSSPKSSSSSKGKTHVSKSGVSMKFRSASSPKSRKNTSRSSKDSSLSNLNKIATLKDEISRLTEEKNDLISLMYASDARNSYKYNSDTYQIEKQLWSLKEKIPEAVNDVKKAEDALNRATDKALNSMFSFLTFSNSDVKYWTNILDERTNKLELLMSQKAELLNNLDNLRKSIKQPKHYDEYVIRYTEVSKNIVNKHKLLNEEMKKAKRVSKPMTKSEMNKIVNMLKGSPVSI